MSVLIGELGRDRDLALVFVRTKRGADRLTKRLQGAGMKAAAIHGDKSQRQRELALSQFQSGSIDTLVATDVAARGIDVDASRTSSTTTRPRAMTPTCTGSGAQRAPAEAVSVSPLSAARTPRTCGNSAPARDRARPRGDRPRTIARRSASAAAAGVRATGRRARRDRRRATDALERILLHGARAAVAPSALTVASQRWAAS